jgi:K+-transporting ATPase KdpF subunit
MNLLITTFLLFPEAKAYGIGALVAVLILGYLIYTLIYPEKL